LPRKSKYKRKKFPVNAKLAYNGLVREIKCAKIIEVVKKLCIDANYEIGNDVIKAILEARKKEESPTAIDILDQILQNAKIAKEEKIPLCQDTGFAVFFVELGQEVKITGGDFLSAFNKGTALGYEEGYLRKSIVADPVFSRINTRNNTPSVVYTDIVPGDKVKIGFCAKGGGAENMSEVKMLNPADGIEGIKNFVVERVKKSGGNPCPPLIVGVGIGGTFEKVAMLSKKALLREPLGTENPDPRFGELEKELILRINKLGIGPMGLGGRTTALAVHIETFPSHIANLPVAVNLSCHSLRRKTVVI